MNKSIISNYQLIIACVLSFCLHSCFDDKKNGYHSNDAGSDTAKSKSQEFSQDSTEIFFEYKYHIESKSQKFPQDSSLLFLQVRIFNERDSLLFNSRSIDSPYKKSFEKPVPTEPLLYAYAMMQEGDSMSFLFNARDYYRHMYSQTIFVDSFAEYEKLRFEIKLEKIFTKDEILNNVAKQLAEKKLEEEFLLAEYIERNYPAAVPTESGMYFIQERQGSGAFAKPHNTVIAHYTVSHINGEPIYSTYTKVDPLKVQVNDPLLFPCLTEGFQKMRKGGRAIIIAPSKIAAGEKGDKTIGIAPYKTLIFDVELLTIL